MIEEIVSLVKPSSASLVRVFYLILGEFGRALCVHSAPGTSN